MTQKRLLKLYKHYDFVSPKVSIDSRTPLVFWLISLRQAPRVAPVVNMSSTTRTCFPDNAEEDTR